MKSFSNLFQASVVFEGGFEFDLDTLLDAANNVSTAQFDVNSTRVEKLTKEIIKAGSLWVAPVVAVLDDMYYLVSGRHRIHSVASIANDYRINNKGTFVKVNPDNPDLYKDFDQVEPVVTCHVVTVTNREALNQLLVAYNGSRTMTAAEKNTAALDSGTLTATTTKKMQWSSMLRDMFPIAITQQTALQFASALFSTKGATAGAVRATPEQLETMANSFCDWFEANYEQPEFPTNIARSTAAIWGMFIPTVLESFNSSLPEKVVTEKRKAKSNAESIIAELQAQLEQRNAALASLGVTSV